MSSRFRSKCTVYRYIESIDDVGGVVKTEAVVYRDMPLQIATNMPNALLQQQGIETQAVFNATIRSRYRRKPVVIMENDELNVDGFFLTGVYRVTGVQMPVIRNGTSIHLTLQRTRESRRESL